MATGQITATGATAALVAGTKISITLDFSGTATVDIEMLLNHTGNWVKIETGITADYHKIYDSPVIATLRLNCTAYTSSVDYSLTTN